MTARFTVAVDLDGCIARGFVRQFRSWLLHRGVAADRLPPDPTGTYHLLDTWDIPRRLFLDELDAACAAGAVYRYAIPDGDGVAAVRTLAAHGVSIRVLTARTQPGARAETARWLAAHQIPHDALTCTINKAQVPFDLLVDDSPTNVQEALDVGRDAVLLHRRWNSDAAHLPRLQRWGDLPHRVATLAAG